jgi:hypothetical protein
MAWRAASAAQQNQNQQYKKPAESVAHTPMQGKFLL